MNDFDHAWTRITQLQGMPFWQKKGKEFTYSVATGAVIPSTTNRVLPKSHFAEALLRAPLVGPGQIQDLQGPSYLWAILTDERVAPHTRG